MITINDLKDKLNLKLLTESTDLSREIKDVYIGDLLSWVMGRAKADSAWLTVMGNINSIAVATLADVSCIILTENSTLDEDARNKANIHDVVILSTEDNSYEMAIKIYNLLKD